MGVYEEKFDRFVQEQFALLEEANKKIYDNAVRFHRAGCDSDPEDGEECEANFLATFVQFFKQELRKKTVSAYTSRIAKLN